jgi:hypothetical protein
MPRTAITDQAEPEAGAARRRSVWLRRVAWLLAIWLAGVASLALVAYGFRLVMQWVGLALPS